MNKIIVISIVLFFHSFGFAQFVKSTQGCMVSVEKLNAETEIMWSGGCKDGFADGRGKLVWFDGDKFIAAYAGDMEKGKWEGNGSVTFSSGDKYVGWFRSELLNGLGTYISSNGDKYIGEFKDNKFDGQGTYTFNYGIKQVAEWTAGKLNGRVIQYDAKGEISWSGIFMDGKKVREEFIDPKIFKSIDTQEK